jgi:hypothetical protein
MCRQTPVTHTITTSEPFYVISIKHSTALPDDGSYDPKHVGVILNVCFFRFLRPGLHGRIFLKFFLKKYYENME